MKPFLLLQSRPEDAASDNEYEGFLTSTGLQPEHLARFRVESKPLSHVDLDCYSGIIIGGGPFNVSDPEDKKSEVQKRVEYDLKRLLDEAVKIDFPFFGACYGVGTLGALQGGLISRKYSEPVGPTVISLTNEGSQDPLLKDMPMKFEAIVGHKEACETLPVGAILLASSVACPVQMFRIKENLYVSQFHPELDLKGITIRVQVYKNAGYFPPEDAQKVIDTAARADLSYPPTILKNFVTRYAQLSKIS